MSRGRWGGALFHLLWRPATAAWLPIAALCSIVPLFLVMFAREWLMAALGTSPAFPPRREFESPLLLQLTMAAMVGLLVGHAIKELQHCQLAWTLPALRRRLWPGVLVTGTCITLLTRELWTVLAVPLLLLPAGPRFGRVIGQLWSSYSGPSLGFSALVFLAYCAGLRPVPASLAGLIAGLFFAPELVVAAQANPGRALLLALPLAGLLLYQALSAAEARRRPFLPTPTLSGGGRLATTPTTRLPRRARGAPWNIERLGTDTLSWLRAGAYENHGFRLALTRWGVAGAAAAAVVYVAWIAVVVSASDAATALWTGFGSGRVRQELGAIVAVSTITILPLSVLLVCATSIALRRGPVYPLSRRRLADIEYWGSLVESLFFVAVLAAYALLLWGGVYGSLNEGRGYNWTAATGHASGWAPLALPRPLALALVIMPLVQLFRLRYLRGPSGWGRVRVFVTVLAIAAAATIVPSFILGLLIFEGAGLSSRAELGLLATLIVLVQLAYRQRVRHYFATADLI